VDNLYEETMLLNRLVIDLQDLAQADAGQLTLVRWPTALEGIVEQAIAILRPRADAKGITLMTELLAVLPLVDVDPTRVGQVLRNLLNNAVAHTPGGGKITVSARVMDQEVAVSVHDTGSGIAPEHLPYVFDRFYRADKSRAPNRRRGPGIGDRQAIGGCSWRLDYGREHVGRGQHLHFHAADCSGRLKRRHPTASFRICLANRSGKGIITSLFCCHAPLA
jgi:K+-sensing histidine kinase KdpD